MSNDRPRASTPFEDTTPAQADDVGPQGNEHDDRPQPGAGPERLAARTAPLWRLLRSRALRVLFVAVMLALLSVALIHQWSTLRREARALSAPVVGIAFGASLAGLACSLMVWRSVLADLGSRLSLGDAARIMFIGQLAKYVPGSVWPVLGQMELGAQRGVPRSRSAVSVLLSSVIMIFTGGLVAAASLLFAEPGSAGRYLWFLLVVPVGLALLSPPVLNGMVNLTLRLLRRPPLQQGVGLRGLTVSACWALLGWILNGAMLYVLMRRLVGHGAKIALVSIGGYALSWVAGFVAVFAPAGAGVREAVMLGVLSTQASTSVALIVALVSRALSVVADATAGAVGAALVGRRQLRALRARRSAGRMQ
jgi:glycosyltransferase 2 family protein